MRFDDRVVVIKQSAMVYPKEGPAGEACGQISDSPTDGQNNQESHRM